MPEPVRATVEHMLFGAAVRMARQLMRMRGIEARRAALANIPETVRPLVEREARRMFEQQRARAARV